MINPVYSPAPGRYESGIRFRRCGRSGILLPEIALGLWHNFGDVNPLASSLEMAHYAFDHGIVHFDLANNYGPSYGSAEETFGLIMKKSFAPFRDELFISSKAGHDMWPGPYGEWGSRKYLMASLDQSLKRMNLDYVDLFYSHRYDPETPLEETLQALVDIVRAGKALYVGISKYPPQAAAFAYNCLSRPIQPPQPRAGGGRHPGPGQGKRRGIHSLLPPGTGTPDRPLPGRNPVRLPHGQGAVPQVIGPHP